MVGKDRLVTGIKTKGNILLIIRALWVQPGNGKLSASYVLFSLDYSGHLVGSTIITLNRIRNYAKVLARTSATEFHLLHIIFFFFFWLPLLVKLFSNARRIPKAAIMTPLKIFSHHRCIARWPRRMFSNVFATVYVYSFPTVCVRVFDCSAEVKTFPVANAQNQRKYSRAENEMSSPSTRHLAPKSHHRWLFPNELKGVEVVAAIMRSSGEEHFRSRFNGFWS